MNATVKLVICLRPSNYPAPIYFTGRSIEENGMQEAQFNSEIKQARIFHCPLIAKGYFQEFALERYPAFIAEYVEP